MGVISVRLNKEDEKVIEYLTAYLEADKSTIIKRSLMGLYEDIIDREAVEYFEAQEAKGNISFLTAAELDATYTASTKKM